MKKRYLFMIAAALFGLTGCINNSDTNTKDKDEAYINETGHEENEAVNTLQVGSKYKIVSPMLELKDAVVEIIGDNYWPDALLSGEELAERTGISDNMYEDFWAEYQHMEAGIDMMIIVKAREENIAEVEQYLNDYRDMLLNIYEQQPKNEAKVSASRIETINNYVCFVQLGADLSIVENQGRDVMVTYCQEENEKAIDIIEKRILQ